MWQIAGESNQWTLIKINKERALRVLYLHHQTIAGGGIARIYLHYHVGLVMNTCEEPPSTNSCQVTVTRKRLGCQPLSGYKATNDTPANCCFLHDDRIGCYKTPQWEKSGCPQRHTASIGILKVFLRCHYVAISGSWADWLASRVPHTSRRHLWHMLPGCTSCVAAANEGPACLWSQPHSLHLVDPGTQHTFN